MHIIRRNCGRDTVYKSGGHGTVTCTFLASRRPVGRFDWTYAFPDGAIPVGGEF
jgi:hypothetical protein